MISLRFHPVPELRFEDLLRGAGRIAALKLLGLATAFAAQVLLARWLGIREFGLYTYALSWCLLLSVPVALGLPTSVVRIVSEKMARGEHAKAAGVIRWSSRWSLASGLSAGGACIAATLLIPGIPEPYVVPLVLGFLMLPLFSRMRVQSGLARGFNRGILAYAPDMLLRHLAVMAAVGALHYGTGRVDGVQALAATGFSLLVLVAGQHAAFRSGLPREVREAEPACEQRSWFGIALPLVLVAGFETITDRLDVLMIGFFLGPSDVACYHAASRLAGLILLAIVSVNALAAPRISALYATGRHRELQETLSRVMPWIFWPSALLCTGMTALGIPGLSLFGPDFVRGYPALVILCFAQLLNACAGPALLVLNMTGLQVRSAFIFGAAALFNGTANLLLIPRYGIEGAAAATGATIVLWNAWMVVTVRRERGILTHVFAVGPGRDRSPR
jgi:O-antigen/teichoic acid export membrane protein